jgi:excisionase family DNA binding protein
MHFALEEEHKLLQDLVARFVRENLMPLEQKVLERDANGQGAYLSHEEHDRIELPRSVHQALTKVVAALHAGKAVTIAPQSMKLTTQQAADLLGVSRPTVVRLITTGALPAERIGNRHRVLLDDVLAYRKERRTRQYEALAATAIEVDINDDPETVRRQLRETRRSVADRRRATSAAG